MSDHSSYGRRFNPARARAWRAGVLASLCVCFAATARAHDELSPFWFPDSSGTALYATEPPALFVHDAGPFQVMVTNMGVIGNPTSGVDLYGARWRGGEYLHSVELWVGAIAEDDLPHVTNGYEFRPSLDPIDTIYSAYEGIPGGGRPSFWWTTGDDDEDGLVDEEFLNGKDDDGDGNVDEDYAAVSQQMFSCEYTDDEPEAMASMANHQPLHLRVRQRTFAWSGEGDNEFIGIDYEITNTGANTLRDVVVGCVLDGDVGRKSSSDYWSDDRAWIFSADTSYTDESIEYQCRDASGAHRDCRTRSIHLGLLGIEDCTAREGGNRIDDLPEDANGSIAIMLLGHTTDVTGVRAPAEIGPCACSYFQKRQAFAIDDFTRYRYLTEGACRPDTSRVPSDYACVVSAGPFGMVMPGESVSFQAVLVVGAGRENLLRNALSAAIIHHGAWRNLDGNLSTGCWGNETCLYLAPDMPSFTWIDPCATPARKVYVKNTDCLRSANWVDNDCDCCTPTQPRENLCMGQETLVHWLGQIAPPPPTVSTENPSKRLQLEGDRRVFLEWDNAPELVPDPFSGLMRFCGYRIWRVEGWDRPAGSVGPAPEDWQRIAELSHDPVGSQLSLAGHTNLDTPLIERVPSPIFPDTWLERYGVGRYCFTDSLGLKNGMLYFYDITSFSCWIDDDGEYHENGQPPGAIESEAVRPRWEAVRDVDWRSTLAIVPNPYHGGAEWDLRPSDADPQGTHIDFIGLPNRICDIRIYTLAGDLVQTLTHDGRQGSGNVSWNLLSRNHQNVTSGVYFYAVTCGQETAVGRFTILR